jgi:dTDP-4-dehydrorhamnose reductase
MSPVQGVRVKKILLIGKTGQVGFELLQTLSPLGTLIAPSREQLDLTSADSISRFVRETKPDIIVNAAGFTTVDQAEMEPELAMQLNATAPAILADVARNIRALLVHYSTTFVFDGTKREPYREDDATHPINTYGKTKLAGEQAIVSCGGFYTILRANWTYSARRTNFALTILKLAHEKTKLDVVDDQIGSPTWARAYASTTANLLRQFAQLREHPDIYHLSAQGQCTRLQWARKLIGVARSLSARNEGWGDLCPTTTEKYPLPATRPIFTATNNQKIQDRFGIQMMSWEAQTKAFVQSLPQSLLNNGILKF